jgi:hypothetical protein
LRHIGWKQVPGRKTDVKDAEWLCQLLEAGLLRARFVPPKPIRNLRNLTRYRKTPEDVAAFVPTSILAAHRARLPEERRESFAAAVVAGAGLPLDYVRLNVSAVRRQR